MAVLIGHASIDENNTIKGGAAGDQTQKEVCTRSWYSKPWTSVIRPKDGAKAEKIARAMEQACANNKIGYDQAQRTTLYTLAKAVGWDISKVTTACECDCSSLVAVCVNAAGIAVSKDIYTGNQQAALSSTGAFTILTESKYTGKADHLLRGDILLGAGHTAIVLSNGSNAKPDASATSTTKTVEAVAMEVINGKWGTGAERKAKLKAAGYDADAVQKRVNELLSGKGTNTGKTVDQLAREVIAGKWGTGAERKAKLKAAGYDADAVQKRVNVLL